MASFLTVVLLFGAPSIAEGLAAPAPQPRHTQQTSSRRAFLSTSTGAYVTTILVPQIANARYVLNEDTGEYDEVTDEDWQTTWSKRLDKAKSMGTEDVFLAAQGAGNLDLKEGQEESEASKKRRALAGCRNDGLRAKGGAKDAKECTASGETISLWLMRCKNAFNAMGVHSPEGTTRYITEQCKGDFVAAQM